MRTSVARYTAAVLVTAAPFILAAALSASPLTFTVNSTADPGDGTCDSTECTLSEAITAANSNPGADTIKFAIPGSGLHTISVASGLPAITEAVTIDGYTQPGSSPNMLAVGDNAVLLIELKGAGGSFNGLVFTAGSSVVRGLVLNNWAGAIILQTGDASSITGNFIGIDPVGTTAQKNGGGIEIDTNNNIVGGTTPGARNVISGNSNQQVLIETNATSNRIEGNYLGPNRAGHSTFSQSGSGDTTEGITVRGPGNTIGGTAPGAGNLISGNAGEGIFLNIATGTNIQGNLIGTDADGTGSNTNGVTGENGVAAVSIGGGTGTIVGGTTAGSRNVISGNTGAGIDEAILVDGSGNTIQGNFIGVDVNGAASRNNGPGILTQAGSNNMIGGTAAGAGNIIAFNNSGVEIRQSGDPATVGNAVLSNSIYSNTASTPQAVSTSKSSAAAAGQPALGIDLYSGFTHDGVTPNDACDGDTGPNNFQNFPTITAATSGAGSTTIHGTLNSTASGTYRIEFFSNPSCDDSGNGEGQTFLGFATVNTDTACNGTFSVALPVAVTAGQVVTSTATDSANNTSEFSACTAVTTAPQPGMLQFSSATYSAAENAGSATITVTRSNGTDGAVSINYATPNGSATAGSDYTAASGTLNFGAGETSKTFTVAILDDTLDENDETVNLTLSNPQGGATLGSPSAATLTILDNEGQPTLRFSDSTYTVVENGGSAVVTVLRSGAAGNAVSVSYSTSDGTATAGSDYTSVSGVLSFASGETSKTFNVPILDDDLFEGDESVNLALSNPAGGAALGTPIAATLTIQDDDSKPTFQFSSTTYDTDEHAGSVTITVTRTGAPGNTVSVDYATADGTAIAGQDYTATSGTLNFASGETSKSFSIPILTDNVFEGDETVDLSLSNAQGAAIGTPGAATVTIKPTTLANISTRLRIGTDNDVLIGGFIITGSQSATLMLRAIGPSLPVGEKLADPSLELYDKSGLIDSNDNWQDSANKQEIIDSTIPPTDEHEAAILRSLAPGPYTFIVRGVGNTTGVGLVEAYNLDRTADAQLSNISTRGLVQTGDNVMIGGFIIAGENSLTFVVRAIGPSLPLNGTLSDPTLDLYDGNGTRLATNNNWKDTQQADIEATGLAPTDDRESAILTTLPPAGYTAIVRGVDDSIGIALVEVFALN